MPLPLLVPLISAGISAAGSIFAASKAAKAQKAAKAEESKRRVEMDRLKGIYSNLDTSNPFSGMENTMEDLTVNQSQAKFQSQVFQQSQSNILGNLKGAAGSSGIGALAQSLAQQGQLNAQQSSISIGNQEQANTQAAAREASNIQAQERRGEVMSRDMKRDQTGTLLGMSQQEVAASRQQGAIAEKAKFDAISSGIEGVTGAIGIGMQTGAFKKSNNSW